MAMPVTGPVQTALTGPDAGGDDAAIIAESLAEPDRYAGRRLGAADAEDVIAATFLAAFRARGRFDTTRADARPWLFGILSKELAKQHRREGARLRAIARACTDVPEAGHADAVADDVTARA